MPTCRKTIDKKRLIKDEIKRNEKMHKSADEKFQILEEHIKRIEQSKKYPYKFPTNYDYEIKRGTTDYSFFNQPIFFSYPEEIFDSCIEDIFVVKCILSFLPLELIFSEDTISQVHKETIWHTDVISVTEVEAFEISAKCVTKKCPLNYSATITCVGFHVDDSELPKDIPYLLPENKFSPPPGFYISLSWTGKTLVEERSCADPGESFDLWGHGDKVYIISTIKCNYCPRSPYGDVKHDTRIWIWSANADEFSAKFPDLHSISFFGSRKNELETLKEHYYRYFRHSYDEY